jgi:hypothetical protein
VIGLSAAADTEEATMSRQQFGFALGFAVAVVWAVAGFLIAVGALVAGLVGYGVARVLDGDVDVRGAVDRLSANRR